MTVSHVCLLDRHDKCVRDPYYK
uniref:Uncharacterized protein n=1 Tax=Arundo donax TaxID=35708 RepID=A0A0A9CDH9_ARUDO